MVPGFAAAVSEKPTATSEHSVTGRTDAPAPEVPMHTQKIGKQLVTALLSWWPIYMSSPGHFEFAGVPRHHTHIQEHLQAIQEQIDQILRLSTSFVSVSVRISSLESVRAKCCALWLVLEWTNIVSWCAGHPWSFGGSPASQRPSGLVWSGVDDIVRGTETPPSWAISLSEDLDQDDCDCVHGRYLIAGNRYSLWVLQQCGCRGAFVAIRTTG